MNRQISKGFDTDYDYESDDMNLLLHRAMEVTKKRKSKKPISMNQYAASVQILEETSTKNLMKLKKTLNGVINQELQQRKEEELLMDTL
jgi:two-component SAPR family response regulator